MTFDPLRNLTLSPGISGFPEICTPSIAMVNHPSFLFVMLSLDEIPMSLLASRSGAPGVPGTLLSITRVKSVVETALFPSLETLVR